MPGRAMAGGGHTSFTVASPSSTLDELLQQVEALKLANARLQSELAGDASHVARLEGEAAQRKDALRLLMLDRSSGSAELGGVGYNGSGGAQPQHAGAHHYHQQRHDAAAAAAEPALAGRATIGCSGGVAGSPRAGTSRSLAGSPARHGTASAVAAGQTQQQQQQHQLLSGDLPGHGSPAARRGLHLHSTAAAHSGRPEQVRAAAQRRGARGYAAEIDSDYHAAAERLRGWAGSDSSMTSADAGSRGSMAACDDSSRQLSCGYAQTPEDPRVKKEKRDSGTFDHTELEKDGLLLRDASTNTAALLGEAFIPKSSADADRSSETGMMTYGPHGMAVVTIGTQTTDVVVTASGRDVDGRQEGGGLTGRQDGGRQHSLASVYHGAWPIAHSGRWNGTGLGGGSAATGSAPETQSVISFHSGMSGSHRSGSASGKNLVGTGGTASDSCTTSVGVASSTGAATDTSSPSPDNRGDDEQRQLGSKVEVVYSLLSMLGTHDPDDASRTLLAMSNSPDSCVAMRQTGCLPLLVQLLHGTATADGEGGSESTHSRPLPLAVGRASHAAKARAARALRNIVRSHPDEKKGWREARVLHNLELLRQHCDRLVYQLRMDGDGADDDASSGDEDDDDLDLSDVLRPNNAKDYQDVSAAVSALMKLSFDEDSRQAICTLGGLQAVAEFIVLDSTVPASFSEASRVTLRRYACMTLTNLTFGDCTNKTLLCSIPGCLPAVVQQLQGFNEDLCQVAASVLRNLSWRADRLSKVALRKADAPRRLTEVALQVRKESSLKSILSALWNLSAHCSENKGDICSVDGALPFLVGALSYRSPSKTLAIVESAGGVLRNVSSVIAVREDLRRLLRRHDYLRVLLSHLRSPSLTVVGNACGALWNISARCREDQVALRDMGAIDMLHSLVTSKHRLISTGAAAALKNLLAAEQRSTSSGDAAASAAPGAKAGQLQQLQSLSSGPTSEQIGTGKVSLAVRRQRQRDEIVSEELSDTCDNLDISPQASPREQRRRQAFAGSGDGGSGSGCGAPAHVLLASAAAGDRAVRGANYGSPMAASLHSQFGTDGQSSSWHNLGSGSGEGRRVDSSLPAGRIEKSASEDSMGGCSIKDEGRVSSCHSPMSAGGLPAAGRSASTQSISKLEQLMKEVMQQASTCSSDAASGIHGASAMPTSMGAVRRAGAGGGAGGGNARPHASAGEPLSRSVFRASATAAPDGSPVTDRAGQQASRLMGLRDPFVVNPALSPRVTKTALPSAGLSEQQLQSVSPTAAMSLLSSYFAGLTSGLPASSSTVPPAPTGSLCFTPGTGLFTSAMLSALPHYGGFSFAAAAAAAAELSSPRSGVATVPFRPGDDDDNCSEKPIDYSRRYAEHPSSTTYDQKLLPSGVGVATTAAAELATTQPAGLQQASSGSAAAAAPAAPGSGTACASEKAGAGELPVAAPFKCKADDDVFGDQDQLKTFCTEGTPMNFLSTATSMNELNRMCFGGDDAQMGVLEEESLSDRTAAVSSGPRSLANGGSGQGATVAQQSATGRPSQVLPLSGDKPATTVTGSSSAGGGGGERSGLASTLPRRLPSDAFDDSPIVYATEDTPLSFSRVSSLSNLSSGTEAMRAAAAAAASAGDERVAASTAVTASERATQAAAAATGGNGGSRAGRVAAVPPISLCLQIIREHEAQGGALTKDQSGSAERLLASSHLPPGDPQHQQQLHHKTVTFSDRGTSTAAAAVQETPMMFSRASSLGSLSSFDAQSVHSSVVSEYSRRASEVVSPSDLPDSPGETAPPTPKPTAKAFAMFQSRVHGLINCDAEPPLAGGSAGQSSSSAATTTGAASAAPTRNGRCGSSSKPAGGARPRISVATYLDGDELLRPFADEGTPDNRSVHSGLSALTFADDDDDTEKLLPPAPPLPPRVPWLYTALRTAAAGAGSVGEDATSSTGGVSERREQALPMLQPTAAPNARNGEGVQHKMASLERVDGASQPLSSLGKLAGNSSASPGCSGSRESTTNAAAAAASGGPADACPERDQEAESSSSEGDEDMLEQCISSALPGGRRRGTGGAAASAAMKKSTSDQSVGEAGGRAAAAAAAAASSVPRSKTFGSKLRVPLSKASKLRRQAPAAVPSTAKAGVSKVGANSPTPDDQLLAAEDCMRTFATEDTPNNFSTATSLSDLSVLDEPRGGESMASRGSEATLTNEAASEANQDLYDVNTHGSSSDVSDSSSDGDDDGVLNLAISSAIPKRTEGKPAAVESWSRPSAHPGKLPGASAAGHSVGPVQRAKPGTAGHMPVSERTAAAGCDNATGLLATHTATRGGSSKPSTPAMMASAEPPTHPRSQIPRPQPVSIASGDGRQPGLPRATVASGCLKATGNELRPGELKSSGVEQAPADAVDSVQVYATEGTPHNFSNATSLSDLTVDSHYSRAGLLARPSTGRADRAGALHALSARPSAVAMGTTASMQPLTMQQSAPVGQGLPPALATAVIRQGNVAQTDGDSVKAYDLEGTPFSYSRRDSLSSLSCDDTESCDARSRSGRDAAAAASTTQQPRRGSAAQAQSAGAAAVEPSCAASSAFHQRKRVAVVASSPGGGPQAASAAAPPWRQPAFSGSHASCGPSDGLSREEELLKFTPVEGTPYCYSRGSPLSSLSSAGDGSDDGGRAGDGTSGHRMGGSGVRGAGADDDETFNSIDAAHKAESLAASLAGRRVGARRHTESGSSCSSSEAASNVSIDSCDEAEFSSAFLSQCIASAMPRKTGDNAAGPAAVSADAKAQQSKPARQTAAGSVVDAPTGDPRKATSVPLPVRPPAASVDHYDKAPTNKDGSSVTSARSCTADGRTAAAAAAALSQLVSCLDGNSPAAPKQTSRDCNGREEQRGPAPEDAGRCNEPAAGGSCGGSSSSDGPVDLQGTAQKQTSRRGSTSQRKE